MEDLIGKSISHYHILEQIGKGGMATVFKAFDTNLERQVAIKMIRREAFPPDQTELLLKRFEREAKALAKLVHPNIVVVIDYGSYDGRPYLVMNYMTGGTLLDKLTGPISWGEAIRILLPVAQALEFAHSQNIIHRDVKPANILLSMSGAPMLTDFGIAKILDVQEDVQLTNTGVGIGTPQYMAPEQWLGEFSPKTDIYALGVVLYQMVTGRLPFSADTPAGVLLMQMNDPLPRPKLSGGDLPEEIEQILVKALAKQPENRYEDMSAFITALNTALTRAPVPSTVPSYAPVTLPSTSKADHPASKPGPAAPQEATPAPEQNQEAKFEMPMEATFVAGPGVSAKDFATPNPAPKTGSQPISTGMGSTPLPKSSPKKRSLLAIGIAAAAVVILFGVAVIAAIIIFKPFGSIAAVLPGNRTAQQTAVQSLTQAAAQLKPTSPAPTGTPEPTRTSEPTQTPQPTKTQPPTLTPTPLDLLKNHPSYLNIKNEMGKDEKIISGNKRYQVQLSADGDLSLIDTQDNLTLWASNTAGSQAEKLLLDASCNLKLLGASDAVVWSAKYSGKAQECYLVLQDDSNLVLYNGKPNTPNSSLLWSAKTFILDANGKLQINHSLVSIKRLFALKLLETGELVQIDLKTGKQYWSTKTSGSNATELTINEAGTVLLKTKDGTVVWKTSYAGPTDQYYYLAIQDDGNLVVYQEANGKKKPVWTNQTGGR